MDDFIGKTGLFRPAVIIVDIDQKPAGVTRRGSPGIDKFN